MSHENLSRRNLLKGALLAVAAAPAATLMSREAATANPLFAQKNSFGTAIGWAVVS